MKGSKWIIDIGGRTVKILTDKDPIDAMEAATRAIELLHQSKLDYKIGPGILATLNGKAEIIPSDIVLANAGKHQQCEDLRALIKTYTSKIKKKPLQ